MRKIKGVSVAIAAAAAMAAIAGTAALAQADSNSTGSAASGQQRVVTNIANHSGQGMTLLNSSTLDNAPFSADGDFHLPKTGDSLSDGATYSYLNTVALPNAGMKSTTTWKLGADATVKISQGSTESAPTCEISGPKAADYTCQNSKGPAGPGPADKLPADFPAHAPAPEHSGNSTDTNDFVISKR
ncbi:hypothetical protein AB0N09_43460 [Streptomyces erythrochromogenes]|uniref:hypothetical protein n=1 Tax=Streptomyces erythrochromogenes TaxID=285574 RepID=UPI0034186DBA